MTQLAHGKDTVPKTCVSSKVLILVMKSKNQIKNNEAYNGTKIGNYFRNGLIQSQLGHNSFVVSFIVV